MTARRRSGGIAAWSVRRPVAVSMLTLALLVPGLLALTRIGVDLLPEIVYPDVRVLILDPGVPAQVMEDLVTRQLEEQLAITEGAISVQSYTRDGRSAVALSFPYGSDVDAALQDASARLDRAKRFLPETIDPPVIYKHDPSQRPVLELVVSSTLRDPVALREWVDYDFSAWFLTLPGVASTEVGGGLTREIRIEPDPGRLADLGLTAGDLAEAIRAENRDAPAGRLLGERQDLPARVAGRVADLDQLLALPLAAEGADGQPRRARLGDVAEVRDLHADQRLRIRLDGVPGVKVSVQKQPHANTVAVVDAVRARLAWLEHEGLLPADVSVRVVGDQSVFVRHALRNAVAAAGYGALLAMIVVYLFLGDLRRTLIVGSAIPVAVLVALVAMQALGLTFNIMTLGGLALGVGLLVDNTIVMLENVYRHQGRGERPEEAAIRAAREVTSPIVASTSTNLAAVLPFLLVGGLVGLLFRDLIVTVSVAIAASLVVALTLVPALGARIPYPSGRAHGAPVDRPMARLRAAYAAVVARLLRRPAWTVAAFLPPLALALWGLWAAPRVFLPAMDEGSVGVSVVGDPQMQLDEMDRLVERLEDLFLAQREVETVFTSAGGFVFGRSEYETGNRSFLSVQLLPADQRATSTHAWVQRMEDAIADLDLVGAQVRLRVEGVRGVRMSRGDDQISLRVQGGDLAELARIGDAMVERLRGLPGLRNLEHSYEERREELALVVDRERAAALGVTVEQISTALQAALAGIEVGDYLEGDRAVPIRLRLPSRHIAHPQDLEDVVVAVADGAALRLRQVARLEWAVAPTNILRDNQRRAVEVSASLAEGAGADRVMQAVRDRLADLALPEGYRLYDGGFARTLREGQRLGLVLLGVAVFLVFVAMAVQYESLRDPLVILLAVPFTAIGVGAGLWVTGTSLSMPVYLGLIMLAGIVVNNAIVLVEQVEIERETGRGLDEALVAAARNRLRPILMTMLTTVAGMTPLAAGIGEGSEMLQPLAVVIVWGLSFSTLVSLLVVPAIYRLMHAREAAPSPVPLPLQGQAKGRSFDR